MKRRRLIPGIPGVAIALSAVVLGVMVAAGVMPGMPRRYAESYAFGSSPLGLGAIVTCTFIVIGLVALKSLSDERYQTERDLLEAFLEHIPDNVFFKDRDSRFVRISKAMADYCGLADPALAVNKTDSDIFTSEHANQALADERQIIQTGRPIIGVEEKETWPDGRQSWVLTTKVPLKDRRGQIVGTMGIAHNITERKLAEARVHFLALHDSLTGLPNRILLEDRLAQATALARRSQTRVAVLMLDLDRFKYVNDSLGHHIGDRLLEAVSTRLKGCLRDSDIVARLGGDEFIVAAPVVDDTADIECIAHKVLASLAEPFEVEGRELRVSASVGVCEYPTDGENPEALLQAADAAMYEAKKRGRGACCHFSKELSEATRNKQKLESALQYACERGEFTLHYQPLISTVSGLITGAEALLRWHHPEQGLISPVEFIPQLEEMGLMVDVGRWALRTACMQNVNWQKEGLTPIRLAVNLSAQQFYRGNIANTVEDILRETGLNPKWLELELTESLTLDATENTIAIMHELKRIGVSLSLDDFGTGWSSLSYLSRFPLDRLKIDRSFMRDIVSRSAARAVVESILNLGRSLGLECVGEGVETPEQLAYLREEMCAEIQGFLYSPPLPAADFGTLLRSGNPGFIDRQYVSENHLYAPTDDAL